MMDEVKKVPVWVWIAGAAIIVGLLILRARSSSSGSSTAQGSTTAGTPVSSGVDSLGTIAGQLGNLQQAIGSQAGSPSQLAGTSAPNFLKDFNQAHTFSVDQWGQLVHDWQDLSTGALHSEVLGTGLVPNSALTVNDTAIPGQIQLFGTNAGGTQFHTWYSALGGWQRNVFPTAPAPTATGAAA